MSAADTIRILLSRGGESGVLDAAEWKRVAARVVWVRGTMAALRAAQREMDGRCTEAVERLDEEAFNRLFEIEQAKVCALLAQLKGVTEDDRWPRH